LSTTEVIFFINSLNDRQELDLKVGVAFSRFQTRYFQGKYGDLDSTLVSYGPCQTPTLGFCVQRHDNIQSFTPEKFWYVAATIVKDGVSVPLEWVSHGVESVPIEPIEQVGYFSVNL